MGAQDLPQYCPVAVFQRAHPRNSRNPRLKSLSERRPESQLQHPRLVGEVIVERWLAIVRVVFVGRIGTVVRVIEQVEHLENAEDLPPLTQRNSLLKAHVHAVDRLPNEALARDDRAIPPVALQGDGDPPASSRMSEPKV